MNLNLVFRFLLFHILCSTHVSDFLSRLMMARVVIGLSFYSEDCFNGGVILFNHRICVCECPVGVNCLWRSLASADLKKKIFIHEFVLCACVCTFTDIHTHIFRVVVFSFSFSDNLVYIYIYIYWEREGEKQFSFNKIHLILH